MASTLSLKNRINTAQNVSKTTRAMQMIAASKLKRAQEITLGSRPYVEKLSSVSREISSKIQKEDLYPYMLQNESQNTLFIVLSPDKGLCGGLVTNLTRELIKVSENSKDFFVNVGRKTEGAILRLKKNLIATFPFETTIPSFDKVFPIEKIIKEYYLEKKVRFVKIIYTHFSNFFSQKVKIDTILPITFANMENTKDQNPAFSFELFEPDIKNLLPSLLEHYLQMSIYQRLLESFLSEQAARMFAMQNATSNAKDIIIDLKLEYNKLRQEKITNEILDISSATFQYA